MAPPRVRVSPVIDTRQREEWYDLSTKSPVGHMHQCLWWLEPLHRYGLRSFALGCWRKDQLVGGALFRSYSVPFLGASLSECLDGPIFLEWEPAWADDFVAGVVEMAQGVNSIAVDITGCPRKDIHADLVAAFRRAGLKATLSPGGADAILPLEGRTMNDIRNGFNHGTKWRIKKGQAESLCVRRLTAPEDLTSAYATWIATAKRKGFSDVRPWGAIEPVLRQCVDNDLGSVIASLRDGQVLAAAFVTHIGKASTWVYGGYLDGCEQHNPTHVLQFEGIRECLEKKLSFYNFGNLISYGQPTRSGVDEFKLGFGARAQLHLDTITWERRPLLFRLIEHLRRGRIGQRLETLLKRQVISHGTTGDRSQHASQ